MHPSISLILIHQQIIIKKNIKTMESDLLNSRLINETHLGAHHP